MTIGGVISSVIQSPINSVIGGGGGTPIPSNARATEDDDIRITEDDQIRITESL